MSIEFFPTIAMSPSIVSSASSSTVILFSDIKASAISYETLPDASLSINTFN